MQSIDNSAPGNSVLGDPAEEILVPSQPSFVQLGAVPLAEDGAGEDVALGDYA